MEQEAGAGWAGSGAAGEAGALGCEGEGPRPMWGGRATRPAAPASSSRRTKTRPAARKAMRAGSGRGMAGGVWDGADPADPGRIHPFPVAAAAERLHGGGGYLREEGIGGVSTRSEGGEGREEEAGLRPGVGARRRGCRSCWRDARGGGGRGPLEARDLEGFWSVSGPQIDIGRLRIEGKCRRG